MQLDSEISEPATLRRLEYVLLILCLCVLALRATYPESPHIETINTEQIVGNDGLSLIISTVLILSAVIWCIGTFVLWEIFLPLQRDRNRSCPLFNRRCYQHFCSSIKGRRLLIW